LYNYAAYCQDMSVSGQTYIRIGENNKKLIPDLTDIVGSGWETKIMEGTNGPSKVGGRQKLWKERTVLPTRFEHQL
jgi:hypothetical protein